MIDYFFFKLSFIKEQIRFYSIEALFFLWIVLKKTFLWKYASYLKSGREKFISLQSSALCHLFFFVFQLTPKVITDINELTHYIITNSALSLSISIEKCEIYKIMLTTSVFIQAESNNIKEESIQTHIKARYYTYRTLCDYSKL
jgi:hypothetical protein